MMLSVSFLHCFAPFQKKFLFRATTRSSALLGTNFSNSNPAERKHGVNTRMVTFCYWIVMVLQAFCWVFFYFICNDCKKRETKIAFNLRGTKSTSYHLFMTHHTPPFSGIPRLPLLEFNLPLPSQKHFEYIGTIYS